MAKPSTSNHASTTLPRHLAEGLGKAYQLLEEKNWGEARDLLLELDRAYAEQPDVLGLLSRLYLEVQDLPGYLSVMEQFHKLAPTDPDVAVGLAGAYASNQYPALAIRAFRNYLRRWPAHAGAAEARKILAGMEEKLPGLLAEMGLDSPDGFEIARLNEELRLSLDLGRYSQGKQLAQKLLKRRPNFVPALNNLCQLYAVEGDYPAAMQAARKALEADLQNVHALSNLTRLAWITGAKEEAWAYAQQLKASPKPASDRWSKQAEALSFIGDDQGVLDLVGQAAQKEELEFPHVDAYFYHLAAVAAMRLGKEELARQYWQEALSLEPGFDLAQENLDELELPPNRRNAPWAFPLFTWVPEKVTHELITAVAPAMRRNNQRAAAAAALRFTHQHPELALLAGHLLDRGDRQTREFVINLASLSKSPPLLEALKGFARGQRAPADLRQKAAQILVENKLLPPGQDSPEI